MTARINAPKTGGRKRGSIDREARKLLTDKMSADLMWCYGKLGGRTWLLKFAEDNPAEFLRQGLSRLFPAPAKDTDADVVNNTQINVGNLSDLEIAQRVAFALNLGIYTQRQQQERQVETIEVQPVQPPPANPNAWTPPDDAPDMPEPENTNGNYDLQRARWANELPLSPEQRRDNAACRETVEATIESYRGGAGEQAGVPRPQVSKKPSAAELCYRRRRDLL